MNSSGLITPATNRLCVELRPFWVQDPLTAMCHILALLSCHVAFFAISLLLTQCTCISETHMQTSVQATRPT